MVPQLLRRKPRKNYLSWGFFITFEAASFRRRNMKILKGIFIILLFYFLGQWISHLIGGFVPGSIIGMILLFVALCLKVVGPDPVKEVSSALTGNMVLFFIPAGAGVLESYGLIGRSWVSIIVVCSVSTVLVLAVVALVQQKMEGKRK